MRTSILFVLCWLTLQVVRAEDVIPALTVDGVTYSNVTFGTVTMTKATIFYTGGVAAFPLGKLPPDLQKRFGYDPQKVAEWEEAQGQESFRRSWTEALAKKTHPLYRAVEGKVYDFSAVIEWQKLAGAAEDQRIRNEQFMRYANQFGNRAVPLPKPSDADLKNSRDATLYREGEPKWSGYQVRGDVVSVLPDGVIVRNPGGKVWLLKNHPDQTKLVDNAQVDVLAMPVGKFTYKTTTGARATVEAYDFGAMPTWRKGQQIVPVPPLDR